MHSIPRIPVDQLERVLEDFPDPKLVEVRLIGKIRGLDLNSYVSSLIPGGSFEVPHGITLKVANPTNRELLKMYRSSQMMSPGELDVRRREGTAVIFRKAEWEFEQEGTMELTPHQILVKYAHAGTPSWASHVFSRLVGSGLLVEHVVDIKQPYVTRAIE